MPVYTVSVDTTIEDEDASTIASQTRRYEIDDLAKLPAVYENASKAMISLTDGITVGLTEDTSGL